ncbi:DNA repair protein RadC [Elioraea sp.]|uniref:RadC family protein n=1 Tax=Elioraea sp. TaxID=2185103 RepID=UPI0038D08F49
MRSRKGSAKGLAEGSDLFSAPDAPAPEPGHLDHRKRMRERLFAAGPEALADYELLEMVLFAVPRVDTKPIAKALIAKFGSFASAIAAPKAELMAVEGMGEGAAAALKVVHAASLRLLKAELRDAPVLSSWDALMNYLHAALAREPVEQVRALYLDNRNRLVADEVHGRGTINHTPLYPREIVRRALELQAAALILVHNHPSGDPTPSRADIDMTRELVAAAKALGLALHDHVIVGNGRWVSFRQEGLL